MSASNTCYKAVSFGAEALTHQAEEAAEDGKWRKARYFKLHLHPPQLTAKHGLDLEREWVDYMHYTTRSGMTCPDA